jgi:hypothetical protein
LALAQQVQQVHLKAHLFLVQILFLPLLHRLAVAVVDFIVLAHKMVHLVALVVERQAVRVATQELVLLGKATLAVMPLVVVAVQEVQEEMDIQAQQMAV